MRLDALAERTRRIALRAAGISELASYILIGGTALALQEGHRLSENLDFVTVGGSLDLTGIERIVSQLAVDDEPRLMTSVRGRHRFANDGFDVDDVQQDWLVDGIKVTFFAPGEADELAVHNDAGRHAMGALSIMGAESIFQLKSMVLMRRRTSRDLFDLWHFVANKGKSIDDIANAMGEKARYHNIDAKLLRIAPSGFDLADPGFLPLLANAPRDKEELLQRMSDLAARHRRHIAAAVARLTKGPVKPPVAPSGPGGGKRSGR